MKIANALLTDWVGSDKAAEASGRVTAALASARAAARDPSDFDACTMQSIGQVIATSALTGIMPSSGSAALAYVLPQRARRGEAPQLQYMLSHRGLNALARRSGVTMVAIPIGNNDEIDEIDGELVIRSRDIDNPPMTFEELRGVGVIVKDIDRGTVVWRGWVPKSIIEKRRANSRSFSSGSGPWASFPVEMAMKTGLKYAVARGWCVIDDTEAVRALDTDSADERREPMVIEAEAVSKSEQLLEKIAPVETSQGGQSQQPASLADKYAADIRAADDSATIDSILEAAWSDEGMSADDRKAVKVIADSVKAEAGVA